MRELLGTIALYGIWGTLSLGAGVLGGMWYVKHQNPAPRLMVLDMRQLVEPLAANPALDATEQKRRVDLLSRRASASIDAYATQGTIVLDASAVLRAPRSVYVQP
jgi:hypothetical protein